MGSHAQKWRLGKGKLHNKYINDQIALEKESLTVQKVYPLHEMWCEYAQKVIGSNGARPKALNQRVSTMDLHGCLVKIIRSKARRSFVGHEGIVVLVSKNRFGIVTTVPEANKLIIVPFDGTVFTFEVAGRIVTVYGELFKQTVP